MIEVCSQVATKPELQPVSQKEFSLSTANIQDGARLDIVMNGFWGEGQSMPLLMSVFLIHLLHPMLPVPCLLAIRSMKTSRKELMDKRSERVSMHASYTPVVMLATGELAHEATYFYKRLASLLSYKWGDEYSVVMGWLQCSLSFSLLHSAIQCVCSWCSFLNSTSCCGSSTNGFSEGGVQFIFRR